MEEESNSLEYTPTWVVAVVCFIIVLASLLAERGLHKLGTFLKHKQQEALFEALQKLKEELMLLGFISLLLTVTQGAISRICIPPHLSTQMLPCKRKTESGNHEKYFHQIINSRRHLLSASSNAAHCVLKGKAQLFSLEALHQLHIFIFVLAVVHVIFCVTTMVLGGLRIRQWKAWEDSTKNTSKPQGQSKHTPEHHHHLHQFLHKHTKGYWKKAAIISWLIAFFRHCSGLTISKSDYIALRQGFVTTYFPQVPHFNFHQYILRNLEVDFKRIVGISWYLWLFVVIFLLLNVEGWHTYFWLAFLPLILLLLVGAKLEHIITLIAHEAKDQMQVLPSDKHFWYHKPVIMLHLIHFILFQNSFEIAFFFWIWCTYGFRSCIMEKFGYIVPRLVMGLIVQVLCSYSTLPLYALVSQMRSSYTERVFRGPVQTLVASWTNRPSESRETNNDKLIAESSQSAPQEMVVIETTTASITPHSTCAI